MQVVATIESYDGLYIQFTVDASTWAEVPLHDGSMHRNDVILLQHTSGMQLRGRIVSDGTTHYELEGVSLEAALRQLPASSGRAF